MLPQHSKNSNSTSACAGQQKHHRNSRQFRVCLHLTRKVDAVHYGHVTVCHHNVWAVSPHPSQDVHPINRHIYEVPVRSNKQGQTTKSGRAVIDQQNRNHVFLRCPAWDASTIKCRR